jgi:hypothetical protein
MARVTYSALVGSVRGSVGGVTFRGGGAGGVVSARVLGRRSASEAQARHRAIMSDARRDFETLVEPDLSAFAFHVSEGFAMRPERGARFSTPRAAYAAWYANIRYTGGDSEMFKQLALLRRYGAALPVNATGDASGPVSFKFYFQTGYLFAPYALWMARAKSATQLPARPVWRLIYAAGWDAPITPENSGLAIPYNKSAEFGPYVAARCAWFRPGEVIAYRYYGPSEQGGAGVGEARLMQL